MSNRAPTFRTAPRPDVPPGVWVPRTPSIAWASDWTLVLAGAEAVERSGSTRDVDLATWRLDATTFAATRLPVEGSLLVHGGDAFLVGGPERWRVDEARGTTTALGPVTWSALLRAESILWQRRWPAGRGWEMAYLTLDAGGVRAYVSEESGARSGEVLRTADGKRVGTWRWPDGEAVTPIDGVGIDAIGL
jgi:hypothetical protein